ncbi:hypothetical protein [Eisenbergiella tayi]|uniref:hypothetical protein n=1 Tax=Eisenbergiella tayi TaxID=1432052 RepID=UPI0008487EBF|nr:hypothetical protein [Eisenbergiella tayi]ODR35473.1 hypothetical protein BEI60_16215 [Eisenbergiella tayi]
MKRRKKASEEKYVFSREVAEKIMNRDGGCFFCSCGYHMQSSSDYGYKIPDIMHVVPKSDLGLGVEQNGVLGCRYHHGLMDNGNKGLHQEMQTMLENYLCELYPGWNRESVRYHKYNF